MVLGTYGNACTDQDFIVVVTGRRDESSVMLQFIRENVPVVPEPLAICPTVAEMRRICTHVVETKRLRGRLEDIAANTVLARHQITISIQYGVVSVFTNKEGSDNVTNQLLL